MKPRLIEQRAWKLETSLATDTRIQLIGGAHAIRQAIVMLLSTTPGERVMRPDYGCPLNELAFAPNDETTAGLAIHYVRESITQWEPRIEILKLDAGPALTQPDVLLIEMNYRIRTTGETDSMQFQFNLAGDN